MYIFKLILIYLYIYIFSLYDSALIEQSCIGAIQAIIIIIIINENVYVVFDNFPLV